MAASVSSLTGAPEKLNWPQIPHISSLQLDRPCFRSRRYVPNSLPIRGGYYIDPLTQHRIASVTFFWPPAEFLSQLSTQRILTYSDSHVVTGLHSIFHTALPGTCFKWSVVHLSYTLTSSARIHRLKQLFPVLNIEAKNVPHASFNSSADSIGFGHRSSEAV